MTVYVWDASSYDGLITIGQARKALAEGIVAVTHRLTRQGGLLDEYAGRNLATFRDAGFGLIGAYAVTYTSGGNTQDDLTVRYADQVAGWWRTFPGWFWQIDLEKWDTDKVSAALGMQVGRELTASTSRVSALYASKGQYGDQLTDWTGPLWNARYPSTREAPFRDLYPGDAETAASGWQRYSGRMPDLWQYSSRATIAGLTTCDVSAYRGTAEQLRALLAPGSNKGDDDMGCIAKDVPTGQYYHCIGGFSHPLNSAQEIADVRELAKNGIISLATGPVGQQGRKGEEWTDNGQTRFGWNPATFGPVWNPAAIGGGGAPDVSALAAAIAKLDQKVDTLAGAAASAGAALSGAQAKTAG